GVLSGHTPFSAVSALLGASGDLLVLVAAFILSGLSHGMAVGTRRARVGDFAPGEITPSVHGAYHTSIGIVRLASGVVAGLLWVVFMPQATFAFGAIAATIATFGLVLWNHPARYWACGRGKAPRPSPSHLVASTRPCGRGF